jgi:hypothetical protein
MSLDPVERNAGAGEDRRSFLKACGKYGLTVPPVMTVLLSTSLSSPALAKSGKGSNSERRFGNNGVGNGEDPQPPGNPKMNDGPGTKPGKPGNRK